MRTFLCVACSDNCLIVADLIVAIYYHKPSQSMVNGPIGLMVQVVVVCVKWEEGGVLHF